MKDTRVILKRNIRKELYADTKSFVIEKRAKTLFYCEFAFKHIKSPERFSMFYIKFHVKNKVINLKGVVAACFALTASSQKVTSARSEFFCD